MSEVNINYKGSTIASMDASGTKTLQTSGKYCEDDVEVVYTRPTAPTPTYQTKSVTPSESAQTVTADSGYDALEEVDVGAISSTYVGSGITRRSSTDLTASGATVTVPAGFYESQASKAVASGTAGTPIATKGTPDYRIISITPSVTNTTGYITGGTKTGNAVYVSASELVYGNKAITANGTNIDVADYATVSVDVAFNPNIGTTTTSSTAGSYSIQFQNLAGEPKMFSIFATDVNSTSTTGRIFSLVYDGSTLYGLYVGAANRSMAFAPVGSFTYSDGTLTISTLGTSDKFLSATYKLIYVY